MAHGQCDSFFMAVYMSTRCPVMVAPAMDHDMFLHAATQSNVKKLESFGHTIIAPVDGELASGLIGKGRMAEPEEILHAAVDHFGGSQPLRGKRALVTAGPTYERIDPVRFIGNFSSGKMGFALAEALANQGAEVVLVSGPVQLNLTHPLVHRINVTSAQEMLEACVSEFSRCDIAVLSAAVADYRPAQVANQKMKKQDDQWQLAMTRTPDIAATLGSIKKPEQRLIGFALETESELEHAKGKLERKNMDMIVMNSLNDQGAGFAVDTNKITLIWPNNKTREFGLKPKSAVAADIVAGIVDLF
jgi:phosphopantothenoylcysteine decarboxylase/phosphopantothenate--cysteine ligase